MIHKIKKIFFLLLISTSVYSQDIYNQLDENGLRHGLWKGTHANSKRPRYEGFFNHGIETGVFKYFDDTKAGLLIATRDFSIGNDSCYVKMFDRKSNIVCEGLLVNKFREGEWKIYHKESKIVMTSEYYRKNKLHGIKKIFYDNGSLAEMVNYENGMRNGIYKRIGINGKILEELHYRNNQLDGAASFYDGSGNISISGQYNNGVKSGIWKSYENGKIVKEESAKK